MDGRRIMKTLIELWATCTVSVGSSACLGFERAAYFLESSATCYMWNSRCVSLFDVLQRIYFCAPSSQQRGFFAVFDHTGRNQQAASEAQEELEDATRGKSERRGGPSKPLHLSCGPILCFISTLIPAASAGKKLAGSFQISGCIICR